MSSKVMLTARLERELVVKINRIARQQDVSVNDLIDYAIDLVERKNQEADSVLDRVALLEKNQAALYDMVAIFGDNLDAKFAEAVANLKADLKHYAVVLEKQLVAHDTCEAERLKDLGKRVSPGNYY